MERFIVTDDPAVFNALIEAGFVPLSQPPLYYVLNSNQLEIPASCKGRCLYTNRVTLGKAVKNEA